MEFEFDDNKSKSNKLKHEIDFKDAQLIWDDVDRLVIPAKNTDEERFLIIGKIKQKLWSAIYTIRAGKIRIISVRRSRNEERKLYENK